LEANDIKKLTALLDERTMKLMERESELADQFEELEAQKEELTAAVEKLIDKNKELLERNQELDQILYRASHDLKSPITSMFGVLNLLKSESIPEGFQDYYNHFELMMHQMNGVVNTLDLLGKSTLDEIKIKVVNLKELVERETNQLKYLSNFKWIDFEISFDGPLEIKTDELLVSILLRSLLSNAIVFREPKKGFIKVIMISTIDELQIEVENDGEGISELIAPKIFEMFYRGSERSIGQGMGLYLVKKIVGRLQGQVAWESTSSSTTFKVLIPLA
jgi:signal transduction histidine kinase